LDPDCKLRKEEIVHKDSSVDPTLIAKTYSLSGF